MGWHMRKVVSKDEGNDVDENTSSDYRNIVISICSG